LSSWGVWEGALGTFFVLGAGAGFSFGIGGFGAGGGRFGGGYSTIFIYYRYFDCDIEGPLYSLFLYNCFFILNLFLVFLGRISHSASIA
jgi:hypothetical protein